MTKMPSRTLPTAPPQYESFDPTTKLVSEQGSETLLVHLSDFRKEQLRVQLSPLGRLRITGERPIGENKWKRFTKEVRVPEDCDAKGIVAKFDGGILYVKQPKLENPPMDAEMTKLPPVQPEAELDPGQVDTPSNTTEKIEGHEAAHNADSREGDPYCSRQVMRGSLFEELKKPEKLGSLVVVVGLGLALIVQVASMSLGGM